MTDYEMTDYVTTVDGRGYPCAEFDFPRALRDLLAKLEETCIAFDRDGRLIGLVTKISEDLATYDAGVRE